MKKPRKLIIPPTRTHRQLTQWINGADLVDKRGRHVSASVQQWTSSTDRQLAGTRLIHPGRGRRGLRLEIWVRTSRSIGSTVQLYEHTSSETYRTHEEARRWVATNLRRARR